MSHETREDPLSQHPVDRILEAAFDVFAERGVRSGTLGEVADRAGVGRATLYRYFPGKHVLVQALLLREARRLFEMLDVELAGAGEDTELMVERGLLAALDHLREHAVLQRVLSEEPDTILPALTTDGQPLIAAAVEFAAPYIERAVKAERLPRMDPRVAAEWAARVLLSLIMTPPVSIDLSDRKQVRRFVSVVLPGPGGKR